MFEFIPVSRYSFIMNTIVVNLMNRKLKSIIKTIQTDIIGDSSMSSIQKTAGMKLDADHVESVISFNVKVMLTATGKSQAGLADYLGLRRSTISVKLSGKTQWSVPDLVNTANFLDTTPEALMDDSMMKAMNKMGVLQGASNPVGVTEPRYFLMPESSECPGCDSNARHLL